MNNPLTEMEFEVKHPKDHVLGEIIRRQSLRCPDRIAVAFRDRSYTYKEFNSAINCLANSLLELGIKKGDKITIFGYNSDYWLIAAGAIAKTGAVSVPANFRLVGHELEYIIAHTDSTAVFVDYALLNIIKDIRDNLSIKHIIVMGEEDPPEGMLSCKSLIASGSNAEPDVHVWNQDLLFFSQTGGTTGKPKSGIHSHYSWMSIAYNINMAFPNVEEDRTILFLPAYSAAGWASFCVAFLHGGSLYLLPTPNFDPLAALDLIAKEKIDYFIIAPPMLEAILAVPEEIRAKFDISSVRFISTVGSPLKISTKENYEKYFGTEIFSCYSASELGLVTLINSEEMSKYPGSVGRAALGREIKIVDDNGNELPPGEIGEIVVYGGGVCMGYYKNPEATKQAFHGKYMGVGDLAYKNEEGYVYIVDRKSDMILSGGINIYPAEIEAVMINHPKILEVAVIGVPDKKWGEAVKALIRLQPGVEADENEIIQWCRGKMADYRIPKSVEFVDDFPRTPVGKVQKNILKARYL